MVSKSELSQRIAARGASHSQAAHAVDAVLGEITAALSAGEKVTLVGFGTFEPVARPARTARNPRTGESVPVKAATVARFHPGTALRAAVDGGPVSLGAVGSLVVPTPAAKVSAPVKAAKPAKPAKAEKPAKPDKDAKAKKPAKAEAKGKKAGKKRKG
jgi:DNA-binding protein HU-beta